MSFRTLMGGAAIVALASVCAVEAQAQQISSAVRGVVTGPNGAPIAGAQVVITHTPSGTTSTTTTTANGGYFASGLRVGGPYTISVSASGYQGGELSDINLAPGNPEPINMMLQSAEQIVVFGTRPETISLNNGVGSSFTSADIFNTPTTARDVVATLLRDPLANSNGSIGNLSIAGKNPRFSGLAIDGLLQGDDFGLSTSIYPTNRSPVSLDIVESAAVAATDYSVTASGFTGGLVNIVTKSGTNDFHGSAFYYRADEDYRGNAAFDQFVPQPAFLEEEYGVTLGGPIIRDKLFFFGSYDKFESGSGINFSGNDAGDQILDPTVFDDIASAIQSGLGYDPGSRPLATSLPITTERYFGKIDWNINSQHRAAFTYQSSEETQTSVDNLSFDTAWYGAPIELKAYGAQLYSDWTDNFSTTLRASYKDYSRLQNCNAGRVVGAIEITLDPTDPENAAIADKLGSTDTFVAGCDRFRHGNTFADTRLQLFGSGDYVWNDHVFTGGAEYEEYDLDNLFVSDSLGTFRFDNLAQVASGEAASVTYRGAADGSGAAAWGYDKLTLFAQDEWQVLANLTVSGGIRYERYIQDDKPPMRQDFIDAYGYSNQSNLDGLDIIMPRIGFRYEPLDRTTISGGFGLFAGGDPKVWTSNAFSPQIFEASASDVMNVNPTMVPQPLLDEVAAQDPSSPSFIDLISPGFEIPSDWKASVRLDQEFDLDFGGFSLGDDYLFSGQLLYTKTKDNYNWVNLAQLELGLETGVAPDGRPIYPNLQALGVDNAIELANVDGGESFIWSVALAKQYESGVAFNVSYAHQDVKDATAGSSSRGVSNWRSLIVSDRNNPEAARAEYETEHKFTADLSYEKNIFGDLPTRLDLIGYVTSGEPLSYTFDVFGNNNPAIDNVLFGRAGNSESPYDNDLLYVPATSGGSFDDPAVVFGSGFDQSGFMDYLGLGGSSDGHIVGRSSDDSAWNQRWDLQIQQDLPFANFGMDRLDGNRLKLVFAIDNVANLLNDEWGTMYNGQGFDTSAIVRADLVTADDVAMNGVDGASALHGNAPAEMCQAAGDCVYRYNSFNPRSNSFHDLSDSVYRIRIGIRYEW